MALFVVFGPGRDAAGPQPAAAAQAEEEPTAVPEEDCGDEPPASPFAVADCEPGIEPGEGGAAPADPAGGP
jgi:hypothetical protein